MGRKIVKSQALADFIADFTSDDQNEDTVLAIDNVRSSDRWKLFVDGARNYYNAGLRIVLISLDENVAYRAIRYIFQVTNNEAEYETVVIRLDITGDLCDKKMDHYSDSQLIVSQIHREYQTRDTCLIAYLDAVQKAMQHFRSVELE